MKIGIDISQVVYQGTGVARFTEGLVNAILKYEKTNQWLFFFSSFRQSLNSELEKKIKDKGHQLVKWKVPPTILSLLWNNLHQFQILNLKFEIEPDWFITSDWTEPLLPINKATIVHDLTVFRYPQTVNNKILNTQKLRLRYVKKESKLIFADSQTTKTDLIKYLDIEPKKIIINYPGVELLIPTEEQIIHTLHKYKLVKPFLLAVGKTEPRKNFPGLIEAFEKLNNKNLDLVIVGTQGWEQPNNATIKQYNNIKRLGLISDNELYSLYHRSVGFIFPSLWEGFGYPLIEAMRLGTPVICSNIDPFREIAGKAAVYFDPMNTEEITNTIDEVVNNHPLQKKLIGNGKIRAQEFSWERYYDTLIKTLNSKI